MHVRDGLAGAVAGALLYLISGPLSALELESHEVLAERDRPEVCFTFDQPLAKRRFELGDYLRVEPSISATVSAHDATLCASGFAHGERYAITLRAGLPAADEQTLDDDVDLEVYVPDRAPALAFTQRGYVLPRGLGDGVPLTSINVERAELKVLRVNDRNLVPQLRQGVLNQGLSGWNLRRLEDHDALPVWQGSVALSGERNRPGVTVLPLVDEIGPLEPGIYAVSAEATDETGDAPQAAQWFLVSDTGLATFQAENGLLVQALSLSDGRPLADIALTLISRANEALGHTVTDAEGFAHFPAGLLRGRGGDTAALLTAEADEDFTFLALETSGVDLLERGGAGRPLPGPLDAWMYTERGIYRPGETVQLLALLRDVEADAVTGMPLTLKVNRPDGQLFDTLTAQDTLGGYAFSLSLPVTAPGGAWTLTLHTGDEEPAIGRHGILVADFVPPQIEVALESEAERLDATAPAALTVRADWLYGAPAAELNGEAYLQLRAENSPFPAHDGYAFGLVQEEVLPERGTAETFTTDTDGRAEVSLAPERLPDTTWPLRAELIATVFDLSGRPLQAQLALPFDSQPFFLGLRMEASEVRQGDSLGAEVIAVDPEGRRIARDGLHWALYYEDWGYVWYREGGRWHAEAVVRDRPVDGGALDVAADAPARIEAPLEWGRYRLEVFDPDGPVATSQRIHAGYWVDPNAPERADAVTVTLDREHYRPGETARVFIDPPYDAEVLLMVADREIREHRRLSVPESGAFVELPVSEEWKVGVHLLVNAYATAESLGGPLPRRAVGLAWLPLDPAPASLALSIDSADEARPRGALPVTLALDGLEQGEEVQVALTVVDDGVLQLTDHAEPDPLGWYHGRRQVSVAQRDLYARLIDPTGDRIGRLVSGGDTALGTGLANLPDRSTEILAFVSGPLRVDAEGRADLDVPLPDFAGRVRLDAVAWSAGRLGAASRSVLIRDPLVAQLTLPRFLAPDDEARVLLGLTNLAGPDGDYRVTLEVEGPLALDRDDIEVTGLARGDERREALRLTATGIGRGTLRVLVEGPDGLRLRRERHLSVRTAQPTETRRQMTRLAPGESVALDASLYAGLLPDTREGSVSLGPLPQLDVPQLLSRLDRYPYGGVEHTVSRALPLIHLEDVAARFGVMSPDETRNRLQQAIYDVVAQQRPDAYFGCWGASSPRELWLTAYSVDFLTRAGHGGAYLPQTPLNRSLERLEQLLRQGDDHPQTLAGQAYAHYLLAREGSASLSELRYFYETRWSRLPTRLARVQVTVALALMGDRSRADAGLARLGEPLGRTLERYRDFGSTLRDQAAELTLLQEAGLLEEAETGERLERLAAEYGNRRYLSTQEMAWVLLAANAVMGVAEGGESATIDGESHEIVDGSLRLPLPLPPLLSEEDEGTLMEIANPGDAPIWQEVSVTGVPEAPLPAEREGMRIRRLFYDLRGEPLDVDALQQNELFIVLLETAVTTPEPHRTLLTQLLPAGWELENLPLNAGGEVEAYPWLDRLSHVERVEYRDDRFIAAVDLTRQQPTARIAFLARAVTPGDFTLPGASVESMYRPDIFARLGPERVSVRER